ncbi:unnamed protein product [Polarella glacialis]|uniref:Uncharacterized protein n=1 Tax=Polarella glacialis TaxID=89957 RepID=A0A813GP08_POLGL|nr:unnamed protein product [Polarella glacialis]
MGQCAAGLICGGGGKLSNSSEAQSARLPTSLLLQRELAQALEAFRLSGNAALGQSAARSKGTEAWGHAFSIAKAVLTGVQTHLPGVLESVKFREGADCAKQCESLPSGALVVLQTVIYVCVVV